MTQFVGKYIGGAGTGKTTTLVNTMSDLCERLVLSPHEIGFVSFTRAARSEAADRVASRFGLDAEDLTRNGWFRTLHSVCCKQLGVGEQLAADP
ncbi:MAG: UvrD-helicase domain-containing protein, partial [Planctomycetota bacterium]